MTINILYMERLRGREESTRGDTTLVLLIVKDLKLLASFCLCLIMHSHYWASRLDSHTHTLSLSLFALSPTNTHHQGPLKRLFVLEKLSRPIYNVNPLIRCRRQFHFDSRHTPTLHMPPSFYSPRHSSQRELCNPTGSSEPVDRLSLVGGLFG